MNHDEAKNAAGTAAADQLAAAMGNIALLLGEFYHQLIKNRIPTELAADMTRDYFETLRERMAER